MKKIMAVLMLTVLGIGCDGSNFKTTNLQNISENFDQLTLMYGNGFTSAQDQVNGNVKVDIANLTVTFRMRDGDSDNAASLCDGTFTITNAEANQLKAAVLNTPNQILTGEEPFVQVSDREIHALDLDGVRYSLIEPLSNEGGNFIDEVDACPIKTLLDNWLTANGATAACSIKAYKALVGC